MALGSVHDITKGSLRLALPGNFPDHEKPVSSSPKGSLTSPLFIMSYDWNLVAALTCISSGFIGKIRFSPVSTSYTTILNSITVLCRDLDMEKGPVSQSLLGFVYLVFKYSEKVLHGSVRRFCLISFQISFPSSSSMIFFPKASFNIFPVVKCSNL